MSAVRRSASFSDTDLSALSQWTQEELRNICLTIWVDAGFVQIALCPMRDQKKAIYVPAIEVSKAQDVHDSYEKLRTSLAKYHSQVVFSTMSFAGPISQDHVVITNWNCEARERVIHFSSLPFDLFPLDRRKFMNDLEAASYGILAKHLSGDLGKIFQPLWDDKTEKISLDGNSVVIFIGDGMGVSYISRNDSKEHNCVVSSEAGHSQSYLCSENDPFFETEYELCRFLSRKLHGGSHMPEWEESCSIHGLELIYRYLKHRMNVKLEKWPKIDEIRTMAMNGDADALLAYRIHYRMLMRAAQQMALGIQCQRVFFISEHHVRNKRIVENFAQELKEVFEDHPRAEWLKKITVYTQIEQSQVGLSGGLFLSRVFAAAHMQEEHF